MDVKKLEKELGDALDHFKSEMTSFRKRDAEVSREEIFHISKQSWYALDKFKDLLVEHLGEQ